MSQDIHIYFHSEGDVRPILVAFAEELQETRKQIQHLIKEIEKVMVDVSKLQASLVAETNAENAVVTLLNSLSSQLKAIPPSTDPVTQAAIDGMVAQVDSNTANLAAAVVANTPADVPSVPTA